MPKTCEKCGERLTWFVLFQAYLHEGLCLPRGEIA